MSSFFEQQHIILASQSEIRRKLLASIGLQFDIQHSNCDEEAIKNEFNTLDWPELGIKLAEAKALAVSEKNPGAYVIAADQLCILENQLLNKPETHERAMKQLSSLEGKTHLQIACCSIAHQQKIIWSHYSTATLSMKTLSRQTIENYLMQEKPYQSCGSYQFEGPGKWLFEKIEGHEDTILGLPLMPLIEGLYKSNAVKLL